MEKIWYAVYTRPRSEKKIASLFERDGIEHFLPLMRRTKIWSDRLKKVDEPLFPSYIFVKITEKEHISVLQTNGVVCFVVLEGRKVPVPEIQIRAIRKYIQTGEEDIENEKDFTVGKKVRVIRGELRGLAGRLSEILGKQRVKVEIEAIGQSVFIKIPLGSLELEGDYTGADSKKGRK